MRKKINKKSIRNIIIALLLIVLFLNLSLWDTSNNKISIFNKVGAAVVVSNSMEPVLSVNDLIVLKKKDNYQVGDIIVYKLNNELVVHRIVKINHDEIITKGDANEYEDKAINLNAVRGELYFSIPYVGVIVNFFKSSCGLFCVVSLVVVMFIGSCIAELRSMSKK